MFPFFANGGLVYQGLIPGRERDTAAVGVIYGQFSDQLKRSQRLDRDVNGSTSGVQQYELVLEWTYIIQVARWLQFQPDFQYIIKPGGTGKIPDAFVGGFQMAINF